MLVQVVTALSLLLSIATCMPVPAHGGEPSGGSVTPAGTPSEVQESIAAIRAAHGDGPVRVILTVNSSRGVVDGQQADLVRRLKAAGALSAEPIEGQPLVVAETSVDVLESLAGSGLVTAVALDSLDAPN